VVAQLTQGDPGVVADDGAGPGPQGRQVGDQVSGGVRGEPGAQVFGAGHDQGPGLVDGLGPFGAGAALGDYQRPDRLHRAVPSLRRARSARREPTDFFVPNWAYVLTNKPPSLVGHICAVQEAASDHADRIWPHFRVYGRSESLLPESTRAAVNTFEKFSGVTDCSEPTRNEIGEREFLSQDQGTTCAAPRAHPRSSWSSST